MAKWYENVYRRMLTDMHISDEKDEYLSKLNADEYFENLVRAKIQSPMIYLQSHTGLCNFPTASARTHKKFCGNENEIKKLIAKCKNAGMKVVGYYSLIFNNWAAENYPYWEMVNAEGKTWRDMGQRYGLCCPNNVEYRKFVVRQIQEIADNFSGLDGIFYDMPYWEVVCHCPFCRARWQNEVGGALPEKEDRADERWLKFVRKRQDWMAEFAAFVRAESLKIMPETTVEFNFAAVVGCDWLAGSTEGINAASEFTGGDLYGDLYNHSFTCKYYYGITKNQPFEYMTCRCNKNLREHTIGKPLAMLESEIMLTCAHHGASLIIDAIDPVGTLDTRVYKTVGKAFEKQLPYEPYMNIGEYYAEAAVYFDSRTQFPEAFSKMYNKQVAVAAVRTLVENHVPVAVVANGNLSALNRYKIIVAPLLQDFENEEITALIDYVKNGGVLYLSGKSDKRLMQTFFDAEFKGYTYGKSVFPHVDKGYAEVQCYVSPIKEDSLFGEFTQNYPLPITYKLPLFCMNKGTDLAKIVLPFTDPDDNAHFASIHSNPPGMLSDFPGMVSVNYGKGKVIWSAASIEADERINFKDLFMRILFLFVDRSELFITAKASKFVETVVFKSGKDVLVSLADLRASQEVVSRKYILEISSENNPVSITDVKTKKEKKYYRKNNKILIRGSFSRFQMLKICF